MTTNILQRTQARPLPSRHQAQTSSLGGIQTATIAIERIEGLLRDETAALRTQENLDLADYNKRKSHSIVDFNNAMRALSAAEIDQAFQDRLLRLRRELAANLALIKVHISATHEIASVLSQAVQNADSDGTYSRSSAIGRS